MHRAPRQPAVWIAIAVLLVAARAPALTLSLVSEEEPYPGVTFRHYRTSSPTTHTWVVLIDLCSERVHVDARRAPSSLSTTASWAGDRGVQVATNGDFYRTDPIRVYGDAMGDGVG